VTIGTPRNALRVISQIQELLNESLGGQTRPLEGSSAGTPLVGDQANLATLMRISEVIANAPSTSQIFKSTREA